MGSFDIAKELELPELPEYFLRIQAIMVSVLPEPDAALYTPLKRIISAPSKRLRSGLLIASYGLAKLVNERVFTACAAIELIHLGSLVHDDIMDGADSRWGIETVHKKEGLNQAILVGDYLFAKANQVASSINAEAADLVATTIVNLCDGQARELSDVGNLKRTKSSYLKAIKGKTGALLGVACELGGLCSAAQRENQNMLREFGESFGMAFQLMDDVLDFVSSPELLGKPTGNDVREGVYTLPVILALQSPVKDTLTLHLKNKEKWQFDNQTEPLLREYLQETILEAKKYNRKAQKSLAGMHSSSLAELPDNYLSWATQNLTKKSYSKIYK